MGKRRDSGNAWNWVDWVNLGLPLAKFLSDAAARLLGFQMLPTRWAHALWGFMTVTLALRFFRYASCLSQFKLIFRSCDPEEEVPHDGADLEELAE